MESKTEPYIISLTDGPPEGYDLCGKLNGKWLDVCHNLPNNKWYCSWDHNRIGGTFDTREEAKHHLIAHIRSFGIEVPNDILDGE